MNVCETKFNLIFSLRPGLGREGLINKIMSISVSLLTQVNYGMSRHSKRLFITALSSGHSTNLNP